jgi:hypothetical protein
MKSKSYFVDRIIKLRGEGNKDELMKLQMVDILQILNEERAKHKKPENDDIADMIPQETDTEETVDEKKEDETVEEKKDEETVEEKKDEETVEEKKEEETVEEKEESDSDSDEESMVSIVKRFLIKSKDKSRN